MRLVSRDEAGEVETTQTRVERLRMSQVLPDSQPLLQCVRSTQCGAHSTSESSTFTPGQDRLSWEKLRR